MTELDYLLAEFEDDIAVSVDSLNAAQRQTLDRAIAAKVPHHHEIKKMSFTLSWDGASVYVRAIAGLPNDEGTTAELIARTEFQVRIGPRGGLKYI